MGHHDQGVGPGAVHCRQHLQVSEDRQQHAGGECHNQVVEQMWNSEVAGSNLVWGKHSFFSLQSQGGRLGI